MICVIEIIWTLFNLFGIDWIGSLGNYILKRNSEMCRNEMKWKSKSPRNNMYQVLGEKLALSCCQLRPSEIIKRYCNMPK